MTSDSDPTSIPDPDFVTEENNPTPIESDDEADVENDAGGTSAEKPEDEGFVPGGGFAR